MISLLSPTNCGYSTLTSFPLVLVTRVTLFALIFVRGELLPADETDDETDIEFGLLTEATAGETLELAIVVADKVSAARTAVFIVRTSATKAILIRVICISMSPTS